MYVSTLEPESSASTNSATFAPERYGMVIVGPRRLGVKGAQAYRFGKVPHLGTSCIDGGRSGFVNPGLIAACGVLAHVAVAQNGRIIVVNLGGGGWMCLPGGRLCDCESIRKI